MAKYIKVDDLIPIATQHSIDIMNHISYVARLSKSGKFSDEESNAILSELLEESRAKAFDDLCPISNLRLSQLVRAQMDFFQNLNKLNLSTDEEGSNETDTE